MMKIIDKIFKKKKNNFSEYWRDIYLHNALQFIKDKKYDTAYTEICWAILKSDGVITKEEEKIFKKLNEKYTNKSEKR